MCGPDVSQLVVMEVFPNLGISHDLRNVTCQCGVRRPDVFQPTCQVVTFVAPVNSYSSSKPLKSDLSAFHVCSCGGSSNTRSGINAKSRRVIYGSNPILATEPVGGSGEGRSSILSNKEAASLRFSWSISRSLGRLRLTISSSV